MVKILGRDNRPKQISRMPRRRFLTGTGALAAAAVLGPVLTTAGKAKASAVVRYADEGGTNFQIRTDRILNPFQKATGIEIKSSTGQKNLAKIRAMVEAKSLEFDVVNDNGPPLVAAADAGFLADLDKSKLDYSRVLFPQWLNDKTWTYQLLTISLCYNEKSLAGKALPTSWSDFWDVGKFPGRRGLLARPNDTLEMALMADGVKPKDLYPLDLDRAYKSLDKIKHNVQSWITDTGQTVQFLQNQELDYGITSTGRILLARQDGLPLNVIRQIPIAGQLNLGILKGASNFDSCMDLVKWFAQKQDVMAKYFVALPGNGPTDKPTYDLMSDQDKETAQIPHPDDPNVCWSSANYWGENLAKIEPRQQMWLLQ